MRDRYQLYADTRECQGGGVRLAGGDESFDATVIARDIDIGRASGNRLLQILGLAAPALGFIALLVAGHHAVADYRDAIGPGLIKLDVEGTAITAGGGILRIDRFAIRRRYLQAVQAQRLMLEAEEVV